jgi:hypothetical protein
MTGTPTRRWRTVLTATPRPWRSRLVRAFCCLLPLLDPIFFLLSAPCHAPASAASSPGLRLSLPSSSVPHLHMHVCVS